MAHDRFVYWQEKKPTKAELEKIITQFFGAFASGVRYGDRKFWIDLYGETSPALRGIRGVARGYIETKRKERWIEVFVDGDSVDIITREQDEATNALADGLMALLLRFHKGSTSR